jgi:hypothetical protein
MCCTVINALLIDRKYFSNKKMYCNICMKFFSYPMVSMSYVWSYELPLFDVKHKNLILIIIIVCRDDDKLAL